MPEIRSRPVWGAFRIWRRARHRGRSSSVRGSFSRRTYFMSKKFYTASTAVAALLALWNFSGVTLAQTAEKNSGAVGSASAADTLGEKRLEWFRDARFGMFIHWGLY